ncbi:MAG TPA: helix-turn-helix domain-containing protein [Burkholderiaceae bacterium]
MTDAPASSATMGATDQDDLSAGALLRRARETRGLHIAALAASIKVSPRKLEALEADRYAELPDLTFTRALAQTVCRALKIDAEPVLDKLPRAGDLPKLAQVGGGLNAPFRGAPANRDPGDFSFYRRPVFWATLLVLAGSLALALLPERWMPWRGAASVPAWVPDAASVLTPVSAPALAPAASTPMAAPATSAVAVAVAPMPSDMPASASIETVPSAPPPALDRSAGVSGSAAGILTLRTSAEAWIEVQDVRGQILLSRLVQAGETVGLDGALPLRLTVGNAAATQLTFRGQAVDLTESTRDNVARLQLPR